MELHEQLLVALRQVIRAIDLHSKKLSREAGLTSPQLVIMQAIKNEPGISPKQVAEKVTLSQGTVTTILDRLESRQLIVRLKRESDRRSWMLQLTDSGHRLLEEAHSPLQRQFIDQFNQLLPWEQTQILSSVQRLAQMMRSAEGSVPNDDEVANTVEDAIETELSDRRRATLLSDVTPVESCNSTGSVTGERAFPDRDRRG